MPSDLQAWTWDFITSISDEVNMFRGRRIVHHWVDIVYILSRCIRLFE